MGSQRPSMATRKPRAGELDWNKIVIRAKEIVESYSTGVTLRQLYYRLVSEGLIPNRQQSYKTLSTKTAAARREGWFPALIDRTRAIERYAHWASPRDAVGEMVDNYRRDRTEDQKWAIYIGVEKHGMTVQLMDWFGKYGIPVLALGGYSSQTFVDVVANDVNNQGRPSVLLYGGDFDPSGIDIDRDFEERTEAFDEIVRVALNKEQVEEYDLPPMPGKETDARKWSFIQKHGELVQVELDALPPEELKSLYEANIKPYFNKKAWERSKAKEAEERERLDSMNSIVDMDDKQRALHYLDIAIDDIADEASDLIADWRNR